MSEIVTQKKVLEKRFRNLNLRCVEVRLLDVHPDWTKEHAAQAVEDYRYFLQLCDIYDVMRGGTMPLIPSFDIDEAWHVHILLTEKYDDETMELFGAKLQHSPDFDLQRKDTIEKCTQFLRAMPQIFQQHFGFVPVSYDTIEEEIARAHKLSMLPS